MKPEEQKNKLQKNNDNDKPIFQLLEAHKGNFEQILGNMIGADRFVRVAVTALKTNTKLMACTTSSIFGGLIQSAQLGLEVNTPLGQAYLIPYRDKATFQLGYKGLIDLFYRHESSGSIQAHVVYENDFFQYEYGLNPICRHIPSEEVDRGRPVKYYAVAKLRNGAYGFEVMSKNDVERHARTYSKSFSDSGSAWKKDFDSMALKTVIIKALKYMPLSIEMQRALAADESVKSVDGGDLDPDLDISLMMSEADIVVEEPELGDTIQKELYDENGALIVDKKKEK